MKKLTLALPAILALALAAVACGGDGSDRDAASEGDSVAATLDAPAGAAFAPGGDETPVTGIAELDRAILEILREDVNALMQRVHVTQRPCVEEPQPGSPPQCPPGVSSGTLVDAMFVAQCEGGYRTSEAQVRSLLELSVFRYGGGASVYAVLRGTLDDTAPDGFVVAIDTRDEMVDGTSGQLWAFNSEGDLVAMALGCGLVPAGDMLAGFFPDPDYVIAPA